VPQDFEDTEGQGLVLGNPEPHLRESLDEIEPRLVGGVSCGGPIVLGRVLAGPQSHELFSSVDHA
jgi:hypothetical protein